jgi:uroporphyrinogen-III decarboxylase
MTPKERMLTALRREQPDRLPASVHQWLEYHLDRYLGGIDPLAAFRRFELDAAIAYFPCEEARSADWVDDVRQERSADGHTVYAHTITTPGGGLSYRVEAQPTTAWITEHLVKRAEDVELIDRYMPMPRLDREAVAREYERVGDDGILRGFIWGLQGGCWQHAAELYGLQPLILATRRDPGWVHQFLTVLQRKKLRFVEENLAGAKFDLIETGGGASSSTCISPAIHREFCLPYDRAQHELLHALGHQVVYHTCGGMMPLLELIVANGCDASETLTPAGMGGDARPTEIKRRMGGQVALIGGLNQFQVLDTGTPAAIRAEVHRLFEELGPGGGYICSPSDHFFETPVANLEAYAAAARECTY